MRALCQNFEAEQFKHLAEDIAQARAPRHEKKLSGMATFFALIVCE
jgi:hypothetical protein